MILKRYMVLGRNRVIRGIFSAALAIGVLSLGLMVTAPQVQAQNIGQRIVAGTVVDDAGAIQTGATVFLKDIKTKTIRSYTTTPDGKFRFTQVNMAEDHEVWAEMSGKKSPVKTVSSWDARKLFEVELKLK